MRVSVIGATGYTGIELIRLLMNHPHVELAYLTSDSYSHQEICDVYPHLSSIVKNGPLHQLDVEQVGSDSDVVFVALPSGVSTAIVSSLVAKGCRVIDLGGDHRLPADLYEAWYHKTAPPEDMLQLAVYGLTEIHRKKIAESQLVTNPGCYPTATQLAIVPAILEGWIDTKRIIVDAKSGVSGAGRGLGLGTHFSEVNENLKVYKIGSHQHTPEIEYHMQMCTNQDVRISFTPHLIPMTRGILATCYMPLRACTTAQFENGSHSTQALQTPDQSHPTNTSVTAESIHAHYCSFYENDPFVRIRPLGTFPQTKEVYGTNYCDIGIYLDVRTEQIIVVSVIDNLVKGAAGQAIQNMNVMFGMDETTGLMQSPMYP